MSRPGGPVVLPLGARTGVLRNALREVTSAMSGMGKQVVILHAVPHFSEIPDWGENPYAWDPRTCSNIAVLTANCKSEMPISHVDNYQGAIRRAVETAAADRGAAVIDLRSSVCTELTCSTSLNGTVMYRGGSHLSLDDSRLPGPNLAPLLSGLLEFSPTLTQ